MHYVKHFDILGVDTVQIPCIELHGVPNTATEGAVGLLGMNVDSEGNEVYICTAVNGAVYTWKALKDGKDGVSVIGTYINTNGELIITLSNGQTFNAGNVKGENGENLYLGETSTTAYPGDKGRKNADDIRGLVDTLSGIIGGMVDIPIATKARALLGEWTALDVNKNSNNDFRAYINLDEGCYILRGKYPYVPDLSTNESYKYFTLFCYINHAVHQSICCMSDMMTCEYYGFHGGTNGDPFFKFNKDCKDVYLLKII